MSSTKDHWKGLVVNNVFATQLQPNQNHIFIGSTKRKPLTSMILSQNTPLMYVFMFMNFQWLFLYVGKATQQEALP